LVHFSKSKWASLRAGSVHGFKKQTTSDQILCRLFPLPAGCNSLKTDFVVSDVTQLLNAIDAGDPKAADELLPLVYGELRRLAALKMAQEKPGQTLQATALVHEAWLRLAGCNQQRWRGRSHFFGAAAEAMRRILIDKARQKASLKRGLYQPLEELHESRIEPAAPSDEILAVHEALDALAAEDATAAEVVKLRYFVGMTIPEIAEALEISPRSADRHWVFARAWLKGAMRGQ
jgi:RNA polymerase sigma factor (TIGR02999 family)